ncbi:hypothetical protein CIPAW_03G024800 [Carya illinoinensis]|uniref:Uncharacterized protein n=1 Tax=Carya illinoinensis TaxID=32201 RepID=A0A8T1QYW8_CARIL|nr:hypothetical protein CIPAW_03G024800 [Carya illinoinensis]
MMIISVMILVMVDGYYCYLFCCWIDMVSCFRGLHRISTTSCSVLLL